jgi:rfaE bifunctional protein kinase chain/domain
MEISPKILQITDLEARITEDRSLGKSLVLCQGHFNIVHPGHLRFFQFAKNLGDRLVVAVIGNEHLPEEFRSQYFLEQDRLTNVAAMEIVDYVLLLEGALAIDRVIEKIRPKFWVLGQEFERERASEVTNEIKALQGVGGQVIFHSGVVQYGSNAPRQARENLDRDRVLQFYQACAKQSINVSDLKEKLADFTKCRLLIVGDTIVDSYVSCEAVGMSSEAPLVVAKELETQNYLGGAGIVAAHARALGASCEYVSVVGEDEVATLASEKLRDYGIRNHVISDGSRPTTFKTRYLIENQKVFRLSRLKDHPLLPTVEDEFIKKLRTLAPGVDGIIVSDFNYGVVTQRVIETLVDLARSHSLLLIGDQQCSSQIGDIRRFHGYDLLCPNEREARISLHNRDAGLEWIANELLATTEVKNLILKMGAAGLIAYSHADNSSFHRSQHFPALVSNPLDVVGAGDTLLAASAISLCRGLDIMESGALGTCVAALAVQNLGNVPVSVEALQVFLDKLNPNV